MSVVSCLVIPCLYVHVFSVLLLQSVSLCFARLISHSCVPLLSAISSLPFCVYIWCVFPSFPCWTVCISSSMLPLCFLHQFTPCFLVSHSLLLVSILRLCVMLSFPQSRFVLVFSHPPVYSVLQPEIKANFLLSSTPHLCACIWVHNLLMPCSCSDRRDILEGLIC